MTNDTNSNGTIRVSVEFYVDAAGSGIRIPEAKRESKCYVWINPTDDDATNLLSRASLYAQEMQSWLSYDMFSNNNQDRWRKAVVRGAKQTEKALLRAGVTSSYVNGYAPAVGSAEDKGACDYYYNRPATPNEDMTQEQIDEYNKGYRQQTVRLADDNRRGRLSSKWKKD